VRSESSCQLLGRCRPTADFDPHGTRPFDELVHRTGEHEGTGIDHDDVIAHPLYVVEQVGGEQDGDAERRQAADEVEHLLPPDGVEPGRRLVEQHELGIGDERLGELHALAHPRRETTDGTEPRLVESDEVENVGRPLSRGARRKPGELAEAGNEVGCRLVVGEAVVLGHVAEPAADADGIGGDRVSDHLDRARCREQQSQHQPEQRGLASTVGADEPDRSTRNVHGEA
jgi:hypothetical protein